jgi:hypothetical protein
MVRRIPQSSSSYDRMGTDDPRPGSPAVGPRFPGLDPRIVVFAHPADWPAWARQAFAEDIAKGLTVGWWNGIPIRGRNQW